MQAFCVIRMALLSTSPSITGAIFYPIVTVCFSFKTTQGCKHVDYDEETKNSG